MAQRKPDGQRQRRNRPSTERMLSEQIEQEVLRLPDDREWHPRTERWVQAVNEDPVSQVWSPAEIESAYDLAELKDRQYKGEAPASAANNIRQAETSLGLNALGKQRLGFKAPKPRPAGRVPARRPSSPRLVPSKPATHDATVPDGHYRQLGSGDLLPLPDTVVRDLDIGTELDPRLLLGQS